MIEQCIAHGLVKARYFGVDRTQGEAKASIGRFEPVEVEGTVGEYLDRMGLGHGGAPSGTQDSSETSAPQDTVAGQGSPQGNVGSRRTGKDAVVPKRRGSRRDFRGRSFPTQGAARPRIRTPACTGKAPAGRRS